ncbi:hypothetical protein AWN76_006460 [Rhodothermaceae bacterium RA]|nr:hypothetical protein AWN76_006460 [Rhodothermaceae bacterium RA]
MASLEFESLDELTAHLDAGGHLRNAVLQNLDLRAVRERILAADPRGAVFLGCTMDAATRSALWDHEALIFPPLPGLPYQPYRAALYDGRELYAGFDPDTPDSYAETLDGRIYRHWQQTGGAEPATLLEALARRLHDLSITNALDEEVRRHERLVAVMGGHGLARTATRYRDVAHLARTLTRRGYVLISGGGPGAMEATHLGACFADRSDDDLEHALTLLATAPHYTDRRWLSTAFDVIDRFGLDQERPVSLGIPTWLYGHEPPTPFASHIAKYFANSLREEGLITLARHGIIFAPGGPGTIQEVFQDNAQNYYETLDVVSPMVFLDRDFWSFTRPAYPLVRQLAMNRRYDRLVTAVDTPAEVVTFLERHPPLR